MRHRRAKPSTSQNVLIQDVTEFIYKGKKFNARKETAQGETYFGIKIFRFYIKCPRCSNEITFKTDPKNTDYVAEHGAQRNFEPWRDTEDRPKPGGDDDDDLARLEAAEQEAEDDDAMRALENRQMDSKREMDILDKLQDIRTRNARMERADADAILRTVSSRAEAGIASKAEIEAEDRRQKDAEEDEAEVRRYFAKMQEDLQIEPIGEGLDDFDGSASPGSPIASASGSAGEGNDDDAASAVKSGGLPIGSRLAGGATKRKMDEIEPEARTLLSEDAKKIAAFDFKAGPPKKKKAVSQLGGVKIVTKAKVKA